MGPLPSLALVQEASPRPLVRDCHDRCIISNVKVLYGNSTAGLTYELAAFPVVYDHAAPAIVFFPSVILLLKSR